jgi:hypothetical protein
MQPESSDGFASVGAILPKEKAALLPGGLFASGNRRATQVSAANRYGTLMEKGKGADSRGAGRTPSEENLSMREFLVALVFVAMLMAPCVVAMSANLDDAGPQ